MAYIELNSLDEITKRLGIDPTGKVQSFLTNTCRIHMDKYVPMDTGALRENVNETSDSITYESPYASYQYYGERADGSHKVSNYTTPGTGSYWDKRMVSAEIDDVISEVQDYIRR